MKYQMFAIFCLFHCLLICFVSTDDNTKTTKFTLRPGRPDSAKVTKKTAVNDVTCSFDFTAQGGTHEDWLISLTSIESSPNDVECTVTRDGKTSYLFFESFSLKIQGAVIDSSRISVMHKGNTLSSEQYRVNDHSVSSTDKFKWEMGFLKVGASVKRDEF